MAERIENEGIPELEVIVVSHGASELLRRCLASLREHPASVPTRVSVVDSGSPDSTPDMVEREFPEVRLIRRDNIGFSAANNTVLGTSSAPFQLLLNPDTEVYAGALDSSLARLEADSTVGMVGCKLVTLTGELDHACKRSFPTPLAALAHFTGIGRRAGIPQAFSQYRATQLGDEEAGEVDAVNGAYMMVRTEALADVGLLDEGYWLYMEDLDWCRRFGLAVTVVSVHSGVGEVNRLEQVSQAAARMISEHTTDGMRIGVAWGTTLASIVRHLPSRPMEDVEVVQINGGANAHTSGIPYVGSMITQFAHAFAGRSVLFPVPTFFDSAVTRRAMWQERSIKPVLMAQRALDVAIFGVGSLTGPVSSHVYVGGYLDDKDRRCLHDERVVGDVCTVFLREDGSWKDIEINTRATGLHPDELRRLERRLCVAAGAAKARAVLGALRARVATNLVVDDALKDGTQGWHLAGLPLERGNRRHAPDPCGRSP